ncbi:MAG: DNA primase [Micrococcales bacterium]|nr:DNA primase [Micrococcales bacterium]
MAGRIVREDVEAVRERVRIDEVIGAHVTLRPAGVGTLKGLCPFHDEKTPSFNVRPQVGRYHCFGCGEGGDVITFVQRIDGLGFAEAVEHLAGRVGVTVRYEDGSAPRPGEEPGRRRRILDAHKVAEEFFRDQLASPAARIGRAFLAERGFDRAAAEQFGVGFAPPGWDALLHHLRGRAFTEAELTASGLVSQGRKGLIDRFRGRLVWPIREVTGDTVGFGARRLHDDDTGPKYLNTPETPVYRKSQVLYGIDLAKREIARTRQAVVVEGYTDVMAMHLSGVGTAVATCGTAFGADHARIVRRLLGGAGGAGGVQLASGDSVGGEVIFTFDGDAAGRAAALKAFGEDQAFAAQTFVAVEATGLDPCELRQQRGPDAVRALVSGRTPMFEFVVRSTLAAHDLDTAEGRVAALRAAAPVVAGIRDTALRPEYTRQLAGWLGLPEAQVREAVGGGRGRPAPSAPARRPDRSDPVVRVEHNALAAVLQYPAQVPGSFDTLGPDAFTVPGYRAVHDAIRVAGGVTSGRDIGTARWVDAVTDAAAESVRPTVTELSVVALPATGDEAVAALVRATVDGLVDQGLARTIANLHGQLQRTDASDPRSREILTELTALETRRRALREQT